MTVRNMSVQKMFFEMAREHQPECSFEKNQSDFNAWKVATLPKVLETVGRFPEKVPANAELITEWTEDGVRKQKWVIDVTKHLSSSVYINKPENIKEGQKLPALLCCHGHGANAKEPVMGNVGSDSIREDISRMNYDYGHQMAKKGFVTYAMDFIGFGEHCDGNRPNHNKLGEARDWCNLYFLNATLLGMTNLSLNVGFCQVMTDFVCTLDEVDEDRLGVMGLSGGGAMTLWVSLIDERFKASEIICYSSIFANYGIRDLNTCGMQTTPNIFKYVDVPDLQGLIAPKPLLVDIGLYDQCFEMDSALECFQKVEKIFESAGVRDKLEIDLFPGGHAWGGNKSVEFFGKYL